jgi:hypothetical protein
VECRRGEMSFLSPGQSTKKPLLSFSSNNDRALIVSETAVSETKGAQATNSMPKRKRTATSRKGKRGKATVRLVKGRLSIRVAGYPGYQRLAPSQLVRYIPLTKLKQAAKRVLSTSGIKKTSRRKKYTVHRHRIGRR